MTLTSQSQLSYTTVFVSSWCGTRINSVLPSIAMGTGIKVLTTLVTSFVIFGFSLGSSLASWNSSSSLSSLPDIMVLLLICLLVVCMEISLASVASDRGSLGTADRHGDVKVFVILFLMPRTIATDKCRVPRRQ